MLAAACVIIALLVTLIVWASRNDSKQYLSDVFILMQPFTNAVLAPSFERQIKQAVPGISKLYFQQIFRLTNGPNRQSITLTQMVIQIVALENSAESAISNANRIAPLVCAEARLLFPEISFNVFNPAVGACEQTKRQWPNFRIGMRRAFEPTPVSGTVAFVGAGILLTPGAEWDQHYGSHFPPTLIGTERLKDQFIMAHLLQSDCEDFQTAANARIEAARAIRGSTTDSFQQNSFTTGSGLHVIRVSFNQNDNASGRVLRTKHSEYITTNGTGRFVMITHIAFPSDQTNEVHQMILRSLKLK